MRLWHKDLIPYLPRQQLLGQWRECCLIAKTIKEKGTPNHILVNKIMNYPIHDFVHYTTLVYYEMYERHYKANFYKFEQYFPDYVGSNWKYDDLFKNWHNDRYLTQCYYNLQEKYDCGGMTAEEWRRIHNFYMDVMYRE